MGGETLRDLQVPLVVGGRLRGLACDDAFIRKWEFYFCYCEGGFAERAIGDAQMLLDKPGNRRAPI